MANKNGNTIRKKLYGATVQFDSAIDYGQVRAQQLAALTRVITGEEFFDCSESEQRNILFLVDDLATEMDALIKLAYDEGRELGEYAARN